MYKQWTVLRNVFSGQNIGMHFMDALKRANLPGPDFLLLKTPGLVRFVPNIAGYDDARNALISLFFLLQGLSPQEAQGFSPHRFRHWLPTLARQIDTPREENVDIGHWEEGMSPQYDEIGGARELNVKATIFKRWLRGGHPVAKGFVPREPPTVSQSLRSVVHIYGGSVHWYRISDSNQNNTNVPNPRDMLLSRGHGGPGPTSSQRPCTTCS